MQKRKNPVSSKQAKGKAVPKMSKEEQLHASMAECIDVRAAIKPDPANILQGRRPTIREIAWYWLPANQENLGQPGNCHTFTIPEATDEETTDSELSIPQSVLESLNEETSEATSTSSEKNTTSSSDVASSYLSSNFASLAISSETSSDDKISIRTEEKRLLSPVKKTRFKNLPSLDKSSVPSMTDEAEHAVSSISPSAKFSGQKQEEIGNFKLDRFTHEFYELLAQEEDKTIESESLHSSKGSSCVELQGTSTSEMTSHSSKKTEVVSNVDSFKLIDPIPLHSPPSPVSPARSSTPVSDHSKPDFNFNVDLISARSSEEDSSSEEVTPRYDELYVCGNYSLYPIAELSEPGSCNSDFDEPLLGFDEFHQTKPKKKSTETGVKRGNIPNKPDMEGLTDSEYETFDEGTESDSDHCKLQMFNKQELGKFPPNKIGIRFKRILKVNGKIIFDCKCNYHLLPARYQKKYRNPENLLLEFNHLLLPSDDIVYFSTHYCPYTIQEMNDIMEITKGLKYLPQSYITQFILHNKYQKPPKKQKMKTSQHFEAEETVVSLIQRPSNAQARRRDQSGSSTSEDTLDSPIVLPPLAERQANRSKRPITRRFDSEVKRKE